MNLSQRSWTQPVAQKTYNSSARRDGQKITLTGDLWSDGTGTLLEVANRPTTFLAITENRHSCCPACSAPVRASALLFRCGGLRIDEAVDAALHPIILAVAPHRVDRIVISRLWFKSVDTHTENRLRVVLVQPYVRLRYLAQITKVGTVTHYTEVLV